MPQGDQKDLKAKIAHREKLLKLSKDHQKAEEAVAVSIEKQGSATGKLLKKATVAKKILADANKEIEKGGEGAKKTTDENIKAAKEWADSLSGKVVKSMEKLNKKNKDFASESKDAFDLLILDGQRWIEEGKEGADQAAQLAKEIVEAGVAMEELVESGKATNDQLAKQNKLVSDLHKKSKTTFKDNFASGAESADKIAVSSDKISKSAHGTVAGYKKWFKGLKDIKKILAVLTAGVAALGAALQTIAAGSMKTLQTELGVSSEFAMKQAFTWRKVLHTITGIDAGIQRSKRALAVAASDITMLNDKADQWAKNMSWVSKNTGASAKSLAEIQEILMLNTELSRDQANNALIGMEAYVRTAGGIPKEVFDDIASSTEEIAKFSDGTADSLMRAATMANKLGINLKTAGTMATSLLNLESSIASEFEASVLIGRELNYDKARTLALNNDIEGAMKEIVGQLGSEEEFLAMNAIQRQAIAESIGVGVDDISKMIGYGAEGGADVDPALKLQKKANKTLMDIWFALTPDRLSNIFSLVTKGITFALGFLGAKSIIASSMTRLIGFVGKGSNIGIMAQKVIDFKLKNILTKSGLGKYLDKIWRGITYIPRMIIKSLAWVGKGIWGIVKAIFKLPGIIYKNFGKIMKPITEFGKSMLYQMRDLPSMIFRGIKTVLGSILRAITWLPRQIAKIKPLAFIKDTWKAIASLPGRIANFKIFTHLGKLFSKGGPLLSFLGPFKVLFSKLSGWLAPLFDIFQTFFGKGEGDTEAGAAGMTFGAAGAGIGALLAPFTGGLSILAGYAIGSIVGHLVNHFFPAVGKKIVEWANVVGGWFKDAWAWAEGVGANVAQKWQTASDWLGDKKAQADQWMADKIEAWDTWIASFRLSWDSVGPSIKAKFRVIWDHTGGMILDSLEDWADDLSTKLSKFFADLGEILKQKWDDFSFNPLTWFGGDDEKKPKPEAKSNENMLNDVQAKYGKNLAMGQFDDFIWRPGHGIARFDKNDTITGSKGGAGDKELKVALREQISMLQVIADKLVPLDVIAKSNEDIKIEAQRNKTTLGK